jgi:hypothetical protein
MPPVPVKVITGSGPFSQTELLLTEIVAVCALSVNELKINPANRNINVPIALCKAKLRRLFLKGGGYVFRSEHM